MNPSTEKFLVIKNFVDKIKYKGRFTIMFDYTEGEIVAGRSSKKWIKDRLESGHLVKV
ncbi:hypothetical protein [Oceanobacillus kimchii]|uniref:Uncharacterized protein n=1 Tax=Oceanobacillus kimchii TaxID=746691 RepID=A0ABQ5TM36_9BACI|nr:hypothetical protein [Oceanobacillus kimchii]GLO66175.1 hypothetical protein MACH08_19590 [Oceanobacillus kimchii]